MKLEKAKERYSLWLNRLVINDLLPVERLLPTIETPCPKVLPKLMEYGDKQSIDSSVLREQIKKLAPWGYGIQLKEGVVTSNNPIALERMIYRSHLITDTVCKILKEDISKTTALDFACNHGYFSLELAFLGAQHVTGIDVRKINIEKAIFLKDFFKIKSSSFHQINIYDLDLGQKFDVVYNLGVLYHVTDPYRLIKLTYDLCKRFAIIDTITHKEPVSAFLLSVNKDIAKHAEGEYVVELHPTYRAVIDLMHSVGFKDLHEIVSVSALEHEDAYHEFYAKHERRCIIGFK